MPTMGYCVLHRFFMSKTIAGGLYVSLTINKKIISDGDRANT